MNKNHDWTLLLTSMVIVMVALLPGETSAQAVWPVPPNDDWAVYTDTRYGFSIAYPGDWTVEPAWETGQSIITALRGPKAQAFVVIENRLALTDLRGWLSVRDQNLVGEVVSEQTLRSNNVTGLRREFTGWEQRSLSAYAFTENKFYEFNAGPVTEETRSIFDQMIASLTLFDTPTLVPVRPSVIEESGHRTSAASPGVITAPSLQFPFSCGVQWQITCGYITDPVCQHPNDQYNRYGLDWVKSSGGTDGQPIMAAHGGKIHNGWDSTGGGNITKVAEDGNFNHYITIYAHLKSFSQSEGAWVSQSDEIAKADCTGTMCFGTHLHFAYWYNNQSIKPEPMSGHTGLQTGQAFTYSCSGNCCCSSATSAGVCGTGEATVTNEQIVPTPLFPAEPDVEATSTPVVTLTPLPLYSPMPADPTPELMQRVETTEPQRTPLASASYRISKSIFGTSGGLRASTHYVMQGTSGQTTGIDRRESNSYVLQSGYWGARSASCVVYLPIVLGQP